MAEPAEISVLAMVIKSGSTTGTFVTPKKRACVWGAERGAQPSSLCVK